MPGMPGMPRARSDATLDFEEFDRSQTVWTKAGSLRSSGGPRMGQRTVSLIDFGSILAAGEGSK